MTIEAVARLSPPRASLGVAFPSINPKEDAMAKKAKKKTAKKAKKAKKKAYKK
jgi:hypothetical protein